MKEPGWVALDRAHVWHPYTQMLTAPPPTPLAGAQGVYLHTTGGRKILDAISSWWVNIHGHNHPRLNQALAAQGARLSQAIFAGFTHEPAALLAAELSRRAPAGLDRVFYSDDGSTAVEVALKMAWQYWKNRGETNRTLFVALEQGYHGDTFGAMAASGTSAFNAKFRELLFEVRFAHAHYEDGSPVGTLVPECRVDADLSPTPGASPGSKCTASIEQILRDEGDRVAAVIIEPMVQGAGGMRIWPAAYLRHVREVTAKLGIPLIADEVMTGFGRTGKMFACEHALVSPDIMCLSKALTGGYLPLGATLCTERIYQAFLSEDRDKTLFHGHSFTGNALSCAVALESLRLFDEEKRLARVAELQQVFNERLDDLRGTNGVREARGIGGIAAIELDAGGGYLSELGPKLYREFLARDILLRPLGNVIYVMPPYIITNDEVHRVFDGIEEVLNLTAIASP